MSLMEFGVDVTNKNRNTLSNALIASLTLAKTVYVNRNYGLDRFKDQEIFVTDRIHSTYPIEESIQVSHDRYALTPQGHMEEWVEMYKTCIEGNSALE